MADSRHIRHVVCDSSNRERLGETGFAVWLSKGDYARLIQRGRWTEGRLSTASAELANIIWGIRCTRQHVQQKRNYGPVTFWSDSERAVEMFDPGRVCTEWNAPLAEMARDELSALCAMGIRAQVKWCSRNHSLMVLVDQDARNARPSGDSGTAGSNNPPDPELVPFSDLPDDLLEVLRLSSALFSTDPGTNHPPPA